MAYSLAHEPDMLQARQAAYDALDGVVKTGKRPVLLVPGYLAVLQERRELAKAGRGFGVTVDTLRSWPEDLWSLHGDGSVPANGDTRQMMLWKMLCEDSALLATPGTAKLLASCAASAMPYAADASGLSPNESAAMRLLATYHDRISEAGIIEPSEILVELASSPALAAYGLVVLGIDEADLTFAQKGFLAARGATLVVDDASAPCDAPREPEITRMLQTIFRRDAETPPVVPSGALRWALASGPSASARLTVDVIGELAQEFPDGPIVVTAKDPAALFSRIAPQLHEAGLPLSLQGRVRFEETDFGRAFLALADLVGAETPNVYEACDYSINPLSGTSRSSAFRTERMFRKDRLITTDSVLSDLAANGGEILMGVIDCLEHARYDDALDSIRTYIDVRFPQQPAYRALQVRALEIAREAMRSAVAFGLTFGEAAPLLQGRTIGFSQTEDERAPIRIMSLQDAASLPPSYARALLMCDMNADAYPVAATADALQTLLGKLGVATTPDPLARARTLFFRVLQCAESRIVLQRALHDADADIASPATMFTEVVDCYRTSIVDSVDFDASLALPKALAPFTTQAGEQQMIRNIRGIDELPLEREEALPPLGEIDPGLRDKIVLPQMLDSDQLYEGTRLSPSQIEAYLECPYQWFAKKRLNLESLDEGFGPTERGSFVHKVMERFYLRFQQAGCSKVDAGNRDQAEPILQDVFLETAQENDSCKPDGNRYAAATPWERRQRADLLPALVRYLDTEAILLPRFVPTYFEWEYGSTVPFAYAGCGIVGRVDRIDVDGEGHAVVIDYKTSVSSDYRLHEKEPGEFQLPRKMQALIYAKVVRDLLGLQVVGALYVNPLKSEVLGAWDSHFIGPADIPFSKSVEASCGRIPYADVEGFDDLLERSETVVENRLDLLKAGMIEPGPLSAEVCKYCPVLLCPSRLEKVG